MTQGKNSPDFLLFAQHGWADAGNDIGRLAQALSTPQTLISAPSLGIIKTFISIKPLVKQLEKVTAEAIHNHPQTPLKVMGHSMGGLIWLEVLNRNPQWWDKVHSLVLIGSPVGGSDLARLIDPLSLGIGTARDLGKNRRSMAEKIAQQIPTLSIASDLNFGSDGLVTVENTKFDYANFILISGMRHAAMKCHPDIVPIIQEFWLNPQIGLSPTEDLATKLIKRLQSVPGMTDASYRDFKRSRIAAKLPAGISIRTWSNPFGINHVFVADDEEKCLYAGYVGLMHTSDLRKAIQEICSDTV
jgi:pimeloyl-ACP methyl ester carboxylesterase